MNYHRNIKETIYFRSTERSCCAYQSYFLKRTTHVTRLLLYFSFNWAERIKRAQQIPHLYPGDVLSDFSGISPGLRNSNSKVHRGRTRNRNIKCALISCCCSPHSSLKHNGRSVFKMLTTRPAQPTDQSNTSGARQISH